MLKQLSDRLGRVERFMAGFCAVLITALIVFNVITRAMNQAVFWVDEIAIFVMVWMVFFAMAVLLKERKAVAVTVLVDMLPSGMRRGVGVFIDLVVLLFGVLLLVFSWQWYAPLDLINAGFDFSQFSAKTMNFMYQDRANTLALQKYWVWLIVPWFALSVCLHTLVNLLDDPRGHHMDKTPEGTP
ncbi:MAG: TRAP transporter small permease [Pusillimonas sp.]